MAKKAGKNNKKKSNYLLITFWFLIFILMMVVFFVKRNQIKQNLEDTDFFGRVFGTTPEFMNKSDNGKSEGKPGTGTNLDLLGAKEPSGNSGGGKYTEVTGTEANKVPESEMQKSGTGMAEAANQKKTETLPLDSEKKTNSATESTAKKPETASQSKTQETPAVQVPKKTEVTLYFVSIDSDGSVSRKSSRRTLQKSDSPLTDSINELLKGPSLDEKGKELMTLIPAGTRLLGASVKNGTATLNFNEAFEINQTFGVEGYIAQLMQIVYTATEFSTVRSVQFLIEGEKKDYLGSEGQWIGTPLARSSF